jgi:VWFA-related protein
MRLLFSGLLVLVINGLPISSRQAPRQSRASEQRSTQQNAKTPSAENRIRTQVNEITTPVTVMDKKGNFVFGIPEKDFHVFDNGVEQHINRWGLDDHPLAIALVVETSAHVRMMAPTIRSTGIIFTEMVMGMGGKAAVISFDNTVDVRQPFTDDHDAVEKAVKGLQFSADGMHLYDAMWQGTLLLEKRPANCHRVLLVIGEAQDIGSKHGLGEILQQVQRATIGIYAIGLSSTAADLRDDIVADVKQGVSPSRGTLPDWSAGGDFLSAAIWLVERATNQRKNHAMEVAVASTGGAYYHAFKDRRIRNALDEVGNELHSQYVLSY